MAEPLRVMLTGGRNAFRVILAAGTLWFALGEDVSAGLRSGSVGLGANFPGIAMRYVLTSRIVPEARFQYASGVMAIGLRASYVFWDSTSRLPLYVGAEMDYLRYQGKIATGTGLAGLTFVGAELQLKPNVSLLADVGPAFITLGDAQGTHTSRGIDVIGNVGFVWYFGGRDAGTVGVQDQAALASPAAGQAPPQTDEALAPPEHSAIDAQYQAAVGRYSAGDIAGAWAGVYAVLQHAPDHWQSWQLLGNCQLANGDPAGARDSYRRSLAIHPDNPLLQAWLSQNGGTP